MTAVQATLAALEKLELVNSLDISLAELMERLSPGDRPLVALSAALASRQIRFGHVCLRVDALANRVVHEPESGPATVFEWPALADWSQALSASPLVGDGTSPCPLVWEQGRLYLYRYWRYQQVLVEAFRVRAETEHEVDEAVLRAGVFRLFSEVEEGELSGQALAAIVAALRGLTVIVGGPGTGKTTTVRKILALLFEQAVAKEADQSPRVMLLAPTGKAANRMREALHDGLDELEGVDAAVKAAFPTEASTIHRALGWQPGDPTRFRHTAENPLSADVVVVDEASMVDLALMAKLVAAVPPSARLILLGDRHQLASVEAGGVLADLCGPSAGRPSFSLDFAGRVERIVGVRPNEGALPAAGKGIWDCIVELRKSYRFDEDSGIGAVARAINTKMSGDAVAFLKQERRRGGRAPYLDLAWMRRTGPPFQALVKEGFGAVVSERSVEAALRAMASFRVLCAVRRGPHGVEQLNARIESWLAAEGWISPKEPFYAGRPVMVLRNDPQLHLYNGDIGVVLPDPEHGNSNRVFFPAMGAEQPRSFAPALLPPVETVFATTIHKSQGSEYTHVVVVLPDQDTPLLTRELLYTGVTRAKKRVTAVGSAAIITAAIGRGVGRDSGLGGRLWEPVG